MSIIGRFSDLKVLKLVDFGIYLDGGEEGEILMPTRYVPEDTQIDDTISAFIYRDSEDRIIATTEKPYGQVGDFAWLKVKNINRIGAFMDWGLSKDLLIPFSQQGERMDNDRSYLVFIYLDEETDRIVGTSKVLDVLKDIENELQEGEEVEILVGKATDLGHQVIVENHAMGVIYKNEIFGKLTPGEYRKAYIKKRREDGKLDISLQAQGYDNSIDDISMAILDALEANNGFLRLNDKSSPYDINRQVGMSKKNFKKAIGTLYRTKLLTIKDDGIHLIKEEDEEEEGKE